jgi:hypothetical protein
VRLFNFSRQFLLQGEVISSAACFAPLREKFGGGIIRAWLLHIQRDMPPYSKNLEGGFLASPIE